MIQMPWDLLRASTKWDDGEDPEEIERVVTDERRREIAFSKETNETLESGGFGEFMKKKEGWD